MRFLLLIFFYVLGLLGACSSKPIHDSKAAKNSMCHGNDLREISLWGKDFNDNETSIHKLPADFNDTVKKWIKYYQNKDRRSMNHYLSRSSRYLPKMKKIFKSHGLPEDLVYITLIESGLKSNARSRANAVGYWQFIRSTGRRYGLKQNYYLDERRDFIHSTEAAAKYLKALYNLFGSWYLAMASYNVGENRIKNLVMRYYTRNFWYLAKTRHLPLETRNYIPKFLAVRLIAKYPKKYGFNDVIYEPPLDFKEVILKNKGLNLRKLARHLGVSKKELYDLNPAYKRGIIPKKKISHLRLPTHIDDKVIPIALSKSRSHLKMNTIAKTNGRVYRIRRGDTLSRIARRFGTSIKVICKANNLSKRTILIPGRKLIIPKNRQIIKTKKSKRKKVAFNSRSRKIRP